MAVLNAFVVTGSAAGSGLGAQTGRPSSAAPPTGTPITGTIVAGGTQGQMQLQTPHGLLALIGRQALPLGSRVTLTLQAQGDHLEAQILSVVRPTGGERALQDVATLSRRVFGFTWPNLSRAQELLGPELVGQGGAASTPLPTAQGNLAAGLLAFIAALRSGGAARLLGEIAARKLDDHPALLKGLERDMAALERLAQEHGPGAWRALFVPVFDGEAWRQLRFFMQRRRDEAEEREGSGERFVVEAELSAIGSLQLDGVLAEKRLDLIVRTHAPLPEDWRDDLRAIFREAAELSGIRGGLTFQAMPDFPVAPLADESWDAADGVLA